MVAEGSVFTEGRMVAERRRHGRKEGRKERTMNMRKKRTELNTPCSFTKIALSCSTLCGYAFTKWWYGVFLKSLNNTWFVYLGSGEIYNVHHVHDPPIHKHKSVSVAHKTTVNTK